MAGYTKEFLIDTFMSRFLACNMLTIEQLVHLEELANDCYDKYGRDKFREYASLDAAAIRAFKNQS